MRELIAKLRYVVENPSAWEAFDQHISDLIAEAVAALSGQGQSPVGVKVKPLEWDDMSAETAFGTFEIARYGKYWAVYFNRDLIAEPDSEPAAKASAQKHFNSAILSALDLPATPAGDVEKAEPYCWIVEDPDGVLSLHAFKTEPKPPFDPELGMAVTPVYRAAPHLAPVPAGDVEKVEAALAGDAGVSHFSEVLATAKALREAQRVYLADRGNDVLGQAVAEAAEALDGAISKVDRALPHLSQAAGEASCRCRGHGYTIEYPCPSCPDPHPSPSDPAPVPAGDVERAVPEPYAWEGYWSGAGSISSQTRLTKYKHNPRPSRGGEDMSAREIRGWAAQWHEFDGPLVHTVRRTRREVMDYMAGVWGGKRGLSVEQAWKRACRKGCRIVPVAIRSLGRPQP